MIREEVLPEIKNAVEKFYENDYILLGGGIKEEAISHRIALYLEGCFDGFYVDCEFNKNGKYPKTGDVSARVRPDIIIHKRGGVEDVDSGGNYIVIEIKKALYGNKIKNDKEKITKMSSLRYSFGFCIGLVKTKGVVWMLYNQEFYEYSFQVKDPKALKKSLFWDIV